MSALSRDALWQRLRDAALVEGDAPAPGRDRSPWFVRVMLGFAGWLGAVFLLLFVGIGLAAILRNAAAAFAVGSAACIGAGLIFRAARGDFAAQFGFALSLAGQALMAFGIAQMLDSRFGGTTAALIAVQQTALFLLAPHYGHRVWCAWSAVYAASHALGQVGLQPVVPALITAAFLALWLTEFQHARRGEIVRAAGYGLALALLTVVVTQGSLWHTLIGSHGWARAAGSPALAWAGALASAVVLVAAVAGLLRREGVAFGSGRGRFALGATLLLAVASLKAPGLGPAAAMLVIGYANGNRILAGLGIVALLGYLSHYYYSLQASLLEKSALLAATGIALLGARLVLRKSWPLQPQAADA